MRVRNICVTGSAVWLAVLVLPIAAGAADNGVRLLEATRDGDRTTVRTLLKQRADVKTAEADGTTALHWAVRADDLETAQLLVRAGADVNAANRYGVTPLVLAATNGNAAIVEMLLKSGANAKSALPEGETVLMTAARTGNVGVIRWLVSSGADVRAKENFLGETALMWAAADNHADAVRLLVEVGADVNARSAPSAIPRLDYPRIGLIPADLPRGSWTALMYASRQGALAAARALAESGADLNATDPAGASALVLAIINSHYDLAAMLIEKGADPNLADQAGMTPLYAAVDMHTEGWRQGRPVVKPSGDLDSVDVVKALLAHGANPNLALKAPTLQRVHSKGDAALGAGTTPLMRAAKWGDVAVMQLLLDHGADPTLRQKNHTTALMIAAGVGKRVGGDEDDTRERGTERDAIEAVKLCLARGVDVNAFNDNGDTALHGATGDALIRFLVEKGARVDAQNRAKQTPLDTVKRARGERSSAALFLSQLVGAPTAAPAPQGR
ncbi:MAG: ankyrin repeat domain-containing protein [Acidobacteriota bacterium]